MIERYVRSKVSVGIVSILILLTILIETGFASSVSFASSVPILPLSEIKPGMKGEALTVIQGEDVVSFPIEIISVVPQLESRPRHLIMVRAGGDIIKKTGGIAAGMSGSPVYINKKLIGAIGYGFNFSEHDIGYVTPIEDMMSIWEWPDERQKLPQLSVFPPEEHELELEQEKEDEKENEITGLIKKAAPLQVGGVSQRTADRLGTFLGGKAVLAGGLNGEGQLVDYSSQLVPGEAVGVLLAWGDVTVGTIGTVTSIDEKGRFLAFGHPFLQKGIVAFPAAKVQVHNVIPSLESPFKVGSFSRIIGTVTQDRAEAVGGQVGYFTPSVDASFRFRDIDRNQRDLKRFHIVSDPFVNSDMTSTLFTGLIDRLWGRIGEGTARISLQIEGFGLPKGWTRSNMFFSDKDIGDEALSEIREIMKAISLNPYKEVYPLGFHLAVEITQKPNVIYIEGLEVEGETFLPGEKVHVEITLRPYRGEQTKKKFELMVPQNAAGSVEVAVRGGGIMPLEEEAIVQGWKSIDNFDQMLKEINALETNNEVILELNYDKVPDDGAKPGPTKEDRELLSQTKERRLDEGTLRIFKTDYVVEGLLREIIQVEPQENDAKERK